MYQDKNLEVQEGEKVEKEWAEEWAARNFGKAHKLPQFDDFDYYIEKNGRILHFLEVKRRYFHSTKYPQTIVPYQKHTRARALIYAEIPVFLLVIWDDRIGLAELWQEPVKMASVLRADRNIENVYAYYNLDCFRFIPPMQSF